MIHLSNRPPWHILVVVVALIGLSIALYGVLRKSNTNSVESRQQSPSLIQDWYYVWWDRVPRELEVQLGPSQYSNIAPQDYVGPNACANCHVENHKKWSQHPHRWMNAVASPESVKGTFDGTSIKLRGGTIVPYRKDGQYRMRLERDSHWREFEITHTIGSRFQQYYIGEFLNGAWFENTGENGTRHDGEEKDHSLDHLERNTKMVLPVGYRIKHEMWAPTYSVSTVNDTDATSDPYQDFAPIAYYDFCAKCHTTMPQGYRMLFDNNSRRLKKPSFHFDINSFLGTTLGEMISERPTELPSDTESLNDLVHDLSLSYSPQKAVTLGISCEACHYGGREHAESGGEIPPRFFPSAPSVFPVEGQDKHYGRTKENVNLLCAQCHSAPRLLLSGGNARVNSSEFRDALTGGCYSQLRCTDCHEPHTAIGEKWPNTPEQDNASCVRCHPKFKDSETHEQHAHHPLSSSGSRCMNCHMPHVNEGIEDMVRTHQISSPAKGEVILGKGANACNLCHLDKTIDWTLSYFQSWYGIEFDSSEIDNTYSERDQSLGEMWLEDRRSEIRMIAMGAIKRNYAVWLAPLLVEELNDFHLINRQFAQDTLETVLNIKLSQAKYIYWLEPLQRTEVLEDVRELVKQAATKQLSLRFMPSVLETDE